MLLLKPLEIREWDQEKIVDRWLKRINPALLAVNENCFSRTLGCGKQINVEMHLRLCGRWAIGAATSSRQEERNRHADLQKL